MNSLVIVAKYGFAATLLLGAISASIAKDASTVASDFRLSGVSLRQSDFRGEPAFELTIRQITHSPQPMRPSCRQFLSSTAVALPQG